MLSETNFWNFFFPSIISLFFFRFDGVLRLNRGGGAEKSEEPSTKNGKEKEKKGEKRKKEKRERKKIEQKW